MRGYNPPYTRLSLAVFILGVALDFTIRHYVYLRIIWHKDNYEILGEYAIMFGR
ncbi:hypothetical protein JCM19039_3674 [Geomicrobium sp. JCM 19039]|nr:hypothetical protein JCM19039_3674 [Geomicrobium sp. JCM 19039]